MLSPIEKVLFALAVAVSLYFTYRGVRRIISHISSGQGRPDWSLAWKRTKGWPGCSSMRGGAPPPPCSRSEVR